MEDITDSEAMENQQTKWKKNQEDIKRKCHQNNRREEKGKQTHKKSQRHMETQSKRISSNMQQQKTE